MAVAVKSRRAVSRYFEYRADAMRLESVSSTIASIGSIKLDDAPVYERFFQAIPPLYADLVDLAVYVYLADRFSLRRDRRDKDGLTWGRKFLLKVPMRRPHVWASPSVLTALQDALSEFTEDQWDFAFETKTGDWRESEKQLLMTDLFGSQRARVSLFSGGLDSLAGTVLAITDNPKERFVLVSGATHGRQLAEQRAQVGILQGRTKASIQHLSITYGIRRVRGKRPVEERSQRSRGFLYLTLGTLAALMAKSSSLDVFENGVGALNLPYNATQVGTAATRAMNPIALAKMERFIRVLTSQSFVIRNPFLFSTKGQMCGMQAFKAFSDVVVRSFSCDGFPHRIAGVPQCGVCTSCLLRRLSLQAAGIGASDPGDFYNVDLGKSEAVDRARLFNLRRMDLQAKNLRRLLASPKPMEAFYSEYPELRDVVAVVSAYGTESPSAVMRRILSLYQTYVSEWQSFSFLKHLNGAPNPMVTSETLRTSS
jgi:7-cyano-7-deazaguanine synthase in queuosine biosynthesis